MRDDNSEWKQQQEEHQQWLADPECQKEYQEWLRTEHQVQPIASRNDAYKGEQNGISSTSVRR